MFLSGTNGTKFRKTSIEKKKKKLGRNISYPQKQSPISRELRTTILYIKFIFFIWMIMLITSEMNIILTVNLIYHHGRCFFIEKDKRNKIKHISHVGLCLFTDV